MLPKFAISAAVLVAILAIVGAYSQVSALHLYQQSQPFYWSHRGTRISGIRYGNRWQPTVDRRDYGNFRGGGIGSGK